MGCYDQCQPHIKLSSKLSDDLKNIESQLYVTEQQISSANKVCTISPATSDGVGHIRNYSGSECITLVWSHSETV